MGNVILLGDFKEEREFVRSWTGSQLVQCHSLQALQQHARRCRIEAVVLRVQQPFEKLRNFVSHAKASGLETRWACFHPGLPEESVDSGVLILPARRGQQAAGCLRRFLSTGMAAQRRTPRTSCRGGVRLKGSEFTVRHQDLKLEGVVQDVSPLGVGLSFEGSLPDLSQDFFLVSFRQPDGKVRRFHAQVRWQRSGHPRGTSVGLQLMAEAPGV